MESALISVISLMSYLVGLQILHVVVLAALITGKYQGMRTEYRMDVEYISFL